MNKKFLGDKKVGQSLLGNFEKKLRDYLASKVPQCIQTYHLTLMTIFWCIGILFFSFIASKNSLVWLNFVSFFIFMQYITDLLDGEIGRRRGTGLIKWGYFMDHFLDYLFLCSIIIGYLFVMPKIVQQIGVIDFKFFIFPIEINYYYLMSYIFGIFVGYMIISFLAFSATNKFQIQYFSIGPTEIRILFILLNTFLIYFPAKIINYVAPIMLVFGAIGLLILVYTIQKKLWKADMEEKENSKK